MIPAFRATFISGKLAPPNQMRLLLPALAIFLLAAVACGTDRGNGDAAAASLQVDGETVTWSPPWTEGDARTIDVTSSIELNDAAQKLLASMEALGAAPEIPPEQSSTIGTVTFISADSDGATGEFAISMDDLTTLLETQTFEQPGFGEADLDQLSAFIGLAGQLDLGVEFGIDSNGLLTGVTNLSELADEVSEFAASLARLAALSGEELAQDEDFEMLEQALAALPDTETAQLAADSAINLATANLFIMRAGEYELGQPVVVAGKTPTFIGLATDGTFTYELKEISSNAAMVQVTVTPGDIDVLALVERLAREVAEVTGEDSDPVTHELETMTAVERSQFEALAGIIFTPYTVVLTIDSETGWVTSAAASVDLALPEGFDDLVEDGDARSLDGVSIMELGVTLNAVATFEPPAAE